MSILNDPVVKTDPGGVMGGGAGGGEYTAWGDTEEAKMIWDETDANANAFFLELPTGGAVDVPVFAVGIGSIGVDLGHFNGLTQPLAATLDLDRDSYIGFSYSADDVAVVRMRLLNGTVRSHTIPDVASDTFTLNAATQTLLSKTLTTPDINAGTADSLTSLSIRSTGAAFDLFLATAAVFTANRTLSLAIGDADRTVTLSGNPTLADWFDQSVKTTANPTFVNLTITSFAANWTNAGRTVADLGIVTTVDVNGGTLDGVVIGGTSAAAGTFTTVTASGTIAANAATALTTTQVTIAVFNATATTVNAFGAATTMTFGAAASATTWTGQSVSFTGANSTNNTTLTVENTSNAAAASHAIVALQVGGTTSTGDPKFTWAVPGGGSSYHFGIDNSSNDFLVLGTGTAVGAANSYLAFWDGRLTTDAIVVLQLGGARTFTIPSGATSTLIQFYVNGETINYTGATQLTSAFRWVVVDSPLLASDTATMTVDKASTLAIAAVRDGTNVSITVSSAIRITNSASLAGAQNGIYIEDMTGGATDYGLTIEGADTAAIWVSSAVDTTDAANGIAFGLSRDTNLYRSAANVLTTDDSFSIGSGLRILSGGASPIGIQVSNSALTVGTSGSMVIPYLAQAGVAFTDAIGGNLNGAIGVNQDTTPGANTIEVRVNGSWLSVAVSGYIIQSHIPWSDKATAWVHEDQVYKANDKLWLDESHCVVCGRALMLGDAVSMYVNQTVPDRGVHAIFGHQHPERETAFSTLKERVDALVEANRILTQKLAETPINTRG